MTPLSALTATWLDVRAAKGRLDKRARMVALFSALDADDLRRAVRWLAGEAAPTGVGWATVSSLAPTTATGPPLSFADVDALFRALPAASGAGAQAERERLLADAFGRAPPDERELLTALLAGGGLRQGAARPLVVDALARALGAKTKDVERAAMVAGLDDVVKALKAGGPDVLTGFLLTPLVAVRPMLASTAGDLAADLASFGGEMAAEWKLDGVRVQLHRRGDEIKVFTRALRDVTAMVPWLVEIGRALPVASAVLDGEAVAFGADGRVLPFQDLWSRFTRNEGPFLAAFFDALHVDGAVVARPNRERRALLERVLDPGLLIQRRIVTSVDEIRAALAEALAHGHEGLVLKALDAPYAAGKRGSSWKKLKRIVTVDLVILAAEWGHGRRRGMLSNLHLGARDATDAGRFWMLGKTFKGLTDAMLRELTETLPPLATKQNDWVVHVRPERVVEIAFDSVQRSPRYNSGLALRFARVKRFRPDKPAAEATSIDEIRALAPR